MAKNINLDRQKKRSAIQILAQKYPGLTNAEIAKIVGTSKMTVYRWRNKNNFKDKIRNRKTKMTKSIKNFLLKKAANKFTGINNASTRKISSEIKKNSVFMYHMEQ